MRFRRLAPALLFVLAAPVWSQAPTLIPLDKLSPSGQVDPAGLSPGLVQLIELDGRFAKDVEKGGGAAFVAWFADDALTLSNKTIPIVGKAHIADTANWNPKDYQLTWYPLGGQMGPSNDMGFTWGHYETHTKDSNGKPVSTSGRYITVWKKLPSGVWKVAMDASAEEPPAAGTPTKP